MDTIRTLLRVILAAVNLIYLIFIIGNIFFDGISPMSGYVLIYAFIFLHIPCSIILIISSTFFSANNSMYGISFKIEYSFLIASIVLLLIFGISKVFCENCSF